MDTYLVSNKKGVSVVEAMVAVAIMGIAMMGMTSMLISQQKETKALAEKLAAHDVSRFITNHLYDPAKCLELVGTANLVTPSQAVFNSTSLSSTSPHSIVLRELPKTGIGSGLEASPLSSTLILNTAAASRPGLRLIITSPTTASLEVNFNQNRLVRSIKDLTFHGLNISLSGSPTASSIASCAFMPKYEVDSIVVASPTVAVMDDPLFTPAIAQCPPGYVITGCSYGLTSYSGGQGNSPDRAEPRSVGNRCHVIAGGLNASAGNSFRAYATCVRIIAVP